ncbi:unnamed protein product [Arctogadus glacialis]
MRVQQCLNRAWRGRWGVGVSRVCVPLGVVLAATTQPSSLVLPEGRTAAIVYVSTCSPPAGTPEWSQAALLRPLRLDQWSHETRTLRNLNRARRNQSSTLRNQNRTQRTQSTESPDHSTNEPSFMSPFWREMMMASANQHSP